MEVLGTSLALLVTFAGFGLLIGILFGFFGMGGSFLVTPALLVMGYPTRVAVGSGLAFVFGTSVIATLKHRDLGQVDYKLGVSMIVGTTLGIEVGKQVFLYLESLGSAGPVISAAYVLLLGGVGTFVTYEALSGDRSDGPDPDAERDVDDGPALAETIQSYHIPPMLTLRGDIQVSLWLVLGVGAVTGLLAGLLGVGGGFLLMPALVYLIGVPVPIAVGTDLFGIIFSGGYGSFTYALVGGVDLSIVVPLLAGSALGAQLGSAATNLVDEEGIKVYFGLMLLGGAIAVAARQVGNTAGYPILNDVSFVLIIGSALLVSGAVVYTSLRALKRGASTGGPTEAD
jgi:uncharacterized membrane protein YfcA